MRTSNTIKRIAIILLATATLLSFFGCNKKKEEPKETSAQTEAKQTEEIITQEKETEPIAAEAPTSGSAHYSYIKAATDSDAPAYINPLTGLSASKDLSKQRPVAIMVNNIVAACPQVGISSADLIYECLAEGGITRLLMLSNDYETLSKVGSIRSSRPYYIDFAMSHDAIYVHAGGSTDAYSELSRRDIDNMDGVNGAHSGSIFYRDPERLKTMAYEHTMVSDGGRLVKGIGLFGYRTTYKDTFKNPITIAEWGWDVALAGEKAEYIKIPYNTSGYDTQIVEYEYNAETQKYLRYQFTHSPHIDSATGEQLAFDNILVLNLDHAATGDSYGHRNVNTVGDGTGYYISKGKKIAVKWSKASKDSEISFTDADGKPLVMNRGKTIINIVEDSVYSTMIAK